jgi:hypothetical protein
MAAKKKSVSQPKPPVDITKVKGVTASKKPASATVSSVKPGGKKVSTPNKGADKGAFAGSSTPLGTSFAGSKLSKGNVAKTLVTAIATPTPSSFAPGNYAARLLHKIAGRYGGAAIEGAADAVHASTTKGLDAIRAGDRLYQANTITGSQLASTKGMSTAQVSSATKGLITRAGNIVDAGVRGGSEALTAQSQMDYVKLNKVAREALSLAAAKINSPKGHKKK